MTNKSTYLMLLAIATVATSGTIFATSSMSADADDINKGIGETEVWEPGPEDGPNVSNDRQGDANLYSEYKEIAKPTAQLSDLSNQELRNSLSKFEQSGLPISTQLIDYDLKRLVFYSPDLSIKDKIAEIAGDTPFVLLYEEAPPRWEHGDPKSEIEPKLDAQSSWLPLAIAAGTADDHTYYGTYIDDNNNADGVYSRMEIHDSGITIDTGNTLYAPTMSMADQGRLEIVVRYLSNTNPTVSVWDHHTNPEGFIYHQSMDSSFMNRYVNTVYGSDYIYTKIEYNGSDWETYIWDLIDSEYDLMVDKNGGAGDQQYGWTIWEAHDFDESGGDCNDTTLLEIVGADVQVRNSGTWSYATSSHASAWAATPLDCATGSWNTNYHNWDVS